MFLEILLLIQVPLLGYLKVRMSRRHRLVILTVKFIFDLTEYLLFLSVKALLLGDPNNLTLGTRVNINSFDWFVYFIELLLKHLKVLFGLIASLLIILDCLVDVGVSALSIMNLHQLVAGTCVQVLKIIIIVMKTLKNLLMRLFY